MQKKRPINSVIPISLDYFNLTFSQGFNLYVNCNLYTYSLSLSLYIYLYIYILIYIYILYIYNPGKTRYWYFWQSGQVPSPAGK